jgi:hypothetical protein
MPEFQIGLPITRMADGDENRIQILGRKRASADHSSRVV